MTPAERKLLSDYLFGHADAVRLCEDILFVAHMWDDQIDKDKVRGDADIDRAWGMALLSIPENPFYRAHANKLLPVLRVAIRDWKTSRVFEQDPEPCIDKVATSFVIRSAYMHVLMACAAIIGGDEYADQTAPIIREKFHSEGLRAYQLRLREEREKRNDHVR